MKMQPVSSSNILAVGYDPVLELLQVDFTSGSSYHYSNVPQNVYEELLGAGSVGSYFARRVKNVYPNAKVA